MTSSAISVPLLGATFGRDRFITCSELRLIGNAIEVYRPEAHSGPPLSLPLDQIADWLVSASPASAALKVAAPRFVVSRRMDPFLSSSPYSPSMHCPAATDFGEQPFRTQWPRSALSAHLANTHRGPDLGSRTVRLYASPDCDDLLFSQLYNAIRAAVNICKSTRCDRPRPTLRSLTSASIQRILEEAHKRGLRSWENPRNGEPVPITNAPAIHPLATVDDEEEDRLAAAIREGEDALDGTFASSISPSALARAYERSGPPVADDDYHDDGWAAYPERPPATGYPNISQPHDQDAPPDLACAEAEAAYSDLEYDDAPDADAEDGDFDPINEIEATSELSSTGAGNSAAGNKRRRSPTPLTRTDPPVETPFHRARHYFLSCGVPPASLLVADVPPSLYAILLAHATSCLHAVRNRSSSTEPPVWLADGIHPSASASTFRFLAHLQSGPRDQQEALYSGGFDGAATTPRFVTAASPALFFVQGSTTFDLGVEPNAYWENAVHCMAQVRSRSERPIGAAPVAGGNEDEAVVKALYALLRALAELAQHCSADGQVIEFDGWVQAQEVRALAAVVPSLSHDQLHLTDACATRRIRDIDTSIIMLMLYGHGAALMPEWRVLWESVQSGGLVDHSSSALG
jgi:hypothetical protein